MVTTQFEPYTIEVTKQLDLSEADERAVARFREEAFADEDPILKMTVGSQLASAERIILWARWRQFVQRISARTADGAGGSPLRTEEVTRRYRLAPQ